MRAMITLAISLPDTQRHQSEWVGGNVEPASSGHRVAYGGGVVIFEGDQALRGDTGEMVPIVTRGSLGHHLMSERQLSLMSVIPVWVSHHFFH